MSALADKRIGKAMFVSPIVNMERLICDMMAWEHITEAELRAKKGNRNRPWRNPVLGVSLLCKSASCQMARFDRNSIWRKRSPDFLSNPAAFCKRNRRSRNSHGTRRTLVSYGGSDAFFGLLDTSICLMRVRSGR